MRKISNYLKQGLPSKIYFLAYPKPISRYAIAIQIYNQQMSAHISESSKKMIVEGYLSEVGPKLNLFSNAMPLVNEIDNELRADNIILTKCEKEELTHALIGDTFRKAVGNISKDLKGRVNAYEILTALLDSCFYNEECWKIQRCEEAFAIATEMIIGSIKTDSTKTIKTDNLTYLKAHLTAPNQR